MHRMRLSPWFLWLGLIVVSLIALTQYFSTKYATDWSKKVVQAIKEAETPSGSVDIGAEKEK
ncbi:MAG: hypothetical protein HW401_896 [Parcubacteria group bacterium]|nr:hypothetical protein [Parcubacteria group bacterium]